MQFVAAAQLMALQDGGKVVMSWPDAKADPKAGPATMAVTLEAVEKVATLVRALLCLFLFNNVPFCVRHVAQQRALFDVLLC